MKKIGLTLDRVIIGLMIVFIVLIIFIIYGVPHSKIQHVGYYKFRPVKGQPVSDLLSPIDKNRAKILLHGVVDYDINGIYVFILKMRININQDSKTIKYSDKAEYWILNTLTDKMTGPMDEKAILQFKFDHALPYQHSSNPHLRIPDSYWARCCDQDEKSWL